MNLRIKQSLPLIPGALPLKSGGAPDFRGTRFPHIDSDWVDAIWFKNKKFLLFFIQRIKLIYTTSLSPSAENESSGPFSVEREIQYDHSLYLYEESLILHSIYASSFSWQLTSSFILGGPNNVYFDREVHRSSTYIVLNT